jgi:anti-sigma-K factor RskA
VPHTDPVILALLAMGETAGTPHDVEHARICARCREELTRLTEVVELARHAGPGERLESPPPQVWDRIAAAVGNGSAVPAAQAPAVPAGAANGAVRAPGAEAAADGDAGDQAPAGSPPGRGTRARRRARARWPRRRLAIALTGLAAGLIIGVGGTAGIVQLTRAPAIRMVAQIELSPLPQFPQWQGAAGTAVMRSTTGQQQIAVTLRAPRRPGFYEVWLLARNGVSMISLGDLGAGHTGTFTVPPGTDLRDYSRIDISLQPFNGSTLHSKDSVVRGTLPAVALDAGGASASTR